MFGTNPITKTEYGDGETLKVVSIFGTIQGEGPYAGTPAIFIRTAGCNLRCWFCDTDFESNARIISAVDIMAAVAAARKQVFAKLVVLTGGEPFAQQVLPLCASLMANGFDVQVETAGSVCPPDPWNGLSVERLAADMYGRKFTVVCSPKTPTVNKRIAAICRDWKYLISGEPEDTASEDGLPFVNTQVRDGKRAMLYRPAPGASGTIWVQPLDAYREDRIARDTEANMKSLDWTSFIARTYGYRVSLQMHKILGVE